MRGILRAIFVVFAFCAVAPGARAAEMVNVEYIHAAVKQKWGITVPYNAALSNPKVAANVKYLLAVVDKANEILNGAPITDYVHGEYATEYAVDTVATNDAVGRLIRKRPGFVVTTTPDTTDFVLYIGAMGNFTIDWGDGAKEVLVRDTVSGRRVAHTYATAGAYDITISGQATKYAASDESTINFLSDITSVSGSLGHVFPTIGAGDVSGTQPIFMNTFSGCKSLTSVPEDLFDGVHGKAAAYQMFYATFQGTGLTSIPENLFAGITAPGVWTFYSTFSDCLGLTSIPENLFAGISGAPAAYGMFQWTFARCSNLTGPSARIDGKYLYEIWPDSGSTSYGTDCYSGATGLDDYATMPASWK